MDYLRMKSGIHYKYSECCGCCLAHSGRTPIQCVVRRFIAAASFDSGKSHTSIRSFTLVDDQFTRPLLLVLQARELLGNLCDCTTYNFKVIFKVSPTPSQFLTPSLCFRDCFNGKEIKTWTEESTLSLTKTTSKSSWRERMFLLRSLHLKPLTLEKEVGESTMFWYTKLVRRRRRKTRTRRKKQRNEQEQEDSTRSACKRKVLFYDAKVLLQKRYHSRFMQVLITFDYRRYSGLSSINLGDTKYFCAEISFNRESLFL